MLSHFVRIKMGEDLRSLLRRKFSVRLPFAVLSFFLGAGLLSWGLRLYKKSRDAASWPQTQGIVLSSALRSHWTGGRWTRLVHEADISYQYSVNGLTYTSTKKIADCIDCDPARVQAVVDKYYPQNLKIPIHYDPAAPSDAFIQSNETEADFIFVILGAISLIPCCLYWRFGIFRG